MAFRALIGDVHGNLPALQAVVAAAKGDADTWMCIGDIVGYGPFPNECVSLVRSLEAESVRGNHDLGSLGAIDLARFNRDARLACLWTAGVLDGDSAAYLESLPGRLPAGDLLLVHGSPRDPVWEYVLSPATAGSCFSVYDERLCFNGHSHIPGVFRLGPEEEGSTGAPEVELVSPRVGDVIELEEGCRYMVNVGSVGQPRDSDPRACYVEHDADAGTVIYRRVEYPVRDTQERMEEVALPRFLIDRLSVGR